MASKGSDFQDTKLPMTDGSGDTPPAMSADLNFRDVGSYGLRQYSGWVREEFLRALVGREAARTYREMGDNSPVVGAVLFTIIQMMRKVVWRITPADDSKEAEDNVEFVQSIMEDMSHSWEDFIVEALSMLQYGWSIHEIVYKKREGRTGKVPSKYDDGRIGIKRIPIRGQDTILKWFFTGNGQIMGVRQQPWIGPLIDLPIEKCLLFRPIHHKNNPEGRSILRTAYRPYYFVKRLEEQEAILFERMSGFPVMSVPSALLKAAAGNDPEAMAAVESYKKIITNVRIDEQMGLLKPSDHWTSADGQISSAEMYKFELVTPSGGSGRGSGGNMNATIERYKLDMLMSVLCDFLMTGHGASGGGSSRGSGAQLGLSKVDMFFTAIQGWVESIADTLNAHLLPRIWRLNNLDERLMPTFSPDVAQRVDLDALGNFCLHLAQAGMSMFPDQDLENYIRDAAGLPNILDEEYEIREQAKLDALMAQGIDPGPQAGNSGLKAPGTTDVPAGSRSNGPAAGASAGVHQPNEVSSRGVSQTGYTPGKRPNPDKKDLAKAVALTPDLIEKSIRAAAARRVLKTRHPSNTPTL